MVKIKDECECPLIKDKCLEISCAWRLTEENMCSIVNLARALNTQKQLI